MLPFPEHGGGRSLAACWTGLARLRRLAGAGRPGTADEAEKKGLRIPFRYARMKENVGQQMRYWVRAARGAGRTECRKVSRKAAGRDRRPIFDN